MDESGIAPPPQPTTPITMNDDDENGCGGCKKCGQCLASIPKNCVANSKAIIGCCTGENSCFFVCPVMICGALLCCCCCCTFEAEDLLPG